MYDGLDLIADLNESDSLVASYTHGPGIDDPLIVRKSGNDYFYYKNHQGSVTELRDSSGAGYKTYVYDAFGNMEETGPTFNRGFTYTGRELHNRSGLYYYRARFYNPKLGRFLTQDPIGYLGGINLYAYAGNVPTLLTDPFGLGTVLIGVGGSFVTPVPIFVNGSGGGEGSIGIFLNTDVFSGDNCPQAGRPIDNFGVFTSGGWPAYGYNISGDVFAGYIPGPVSNLSGRTVNGNIVYDVYSVTGMIGSDSKPVGVTLGVGPGVPALGGSITLSTTKVLTAGQVWDFSVEQSINHTIRTLAAQEGLGIQ